MPALKAARHVHATVTDSSRGCSCPAARHAVTTGNAQLEQQDDALALRCVVCRSILPSQHRLLRRLQRPAQPHQQLRRGPRPRGLPREPSCFLRGQQQGLYRPARLLPQRPQLPLQLLRCPPCRRCQVSQGVSRQLLHLCRPPQQQSHCHISRRSVGSGSDIWQELLDGAHTARPQSPLVAPALTSHQPS